MNLLFVSKCATLAAICLTCATSFDKMCDAQVKNMGMVTLTSTDGKYLQAYASVGASGELHASNPHQNEEETWFLFQVDPSTKIFALANYRSMYFLNRHTGGATNHRVTANSHDIINTAKWSMETGATYGLPVNYVCFKAFDGSYLLANRGGDNAAGEPGEVYAEMDPKPGDKNWKGWFVIGEVTDKPVPGSNAITAVGGAFAGAANAVVSGVGAVLNVLINGPTPPNNGAGGPNDGDKTPIGACVVPDTVGSGRCTVMHQDQCATLGSASSPPDFFANDNCQNHLPPY